MYKGFTKKFLPVLNQKTGVDLQNTFLWNVYTDKDIQSTSNKKKYKDQQARGFHNMQYSNQSSVGHALTDVQNKLDQLKSVLYLQKKNPGPAILKTGT